jgi:hypothetical protein
MERYLIERMDEVNEYRVWRVTRWTHTVDVDRAPRLSQKEADLMRDALKPDELLWREQDVLNGKAGQRISVIRKGERRSG